MTNAATLTSIPKDDDLSVLNREALTRIYNQFAVPKGLKPVKVFQTRAKALARVQGLRDGTLKTNPVEATEEETPEVTTKTKTKATRPPKGPRAGRPAQVLDLKAASTIRAPRPGTMRAQIAKMLERDSGATVEQVNNQVGEGKWTVRHTREHIRLLHSSCGYGLKEDADTRRIHLIGTANVPAASAKGK